MKYCVYGDGQTVAQENGTICPSNNLVAPLVDEFEIADTSITVNYDPFWANVAIVAMFVLPWLFRKKS